MKHRTSRSFWDRFHALPRDVAGRAVKQYALLESDPFHPSLNFKKVGRYWSARVDRDYRAAAEQQPDGSFLWFWIGPHDEYDKLLARR